MTIFGDAISALQTMSLALTSVTMKSAPDNVISNAEPAPFSIAYLARGGASKPNSTTLKVKATIHVDFYFSITNPKATYANVNAISMEYMKSIANDVTLGTKITTVIMTDDEQPTFENLGMADYGGVSFYLVRFFVPVKQMEALP